MDELIGQVLVEWIRMILAGGLLWGAWLAFRSTGQQRARTRPDDDVTQVWAVVLLVAIAITPPPASASDSMREALAEYQNGSYAQALNRFEAMARRGSGEAQEIAGFMYLGGPRLYGDAVPYDRDRASYWFERAAQNNRDVARHMLCVLNGHPELTVTARHRCRGATGPR
jgi:hypothetical protein